MAGNHAPGTCTAGGAAGRRPGATGEDGQAPQRLPAAAAHSRPALGDVADAGGPDHPLAVAPSVGEHVEDGFGCGVDRAGRRTHLRLHGNWILLCHSAARAALAPHAPCTPPPGWADADAR